MGVTAWYPSSEAPSMTSTLLGSATDRNRVGSSGPWAQTGPMRFADLGPYFAITCYPGSAPAGAGWQPLAELVTDPVALSSRIETVRARLSPGDRPVERRPVASAVLLGLAARLLSPVLASAIVDGRTLDLELRRLFWRPTSDSGFPLAIPADSAPATDLVSGLAELLTGPIGELVAAVRAACPLSPRVAWGNVGSALNGAAIVLGQQRPDLAAETYRLTAAVLARSPLNLVKPVAGPAFRRNSCCLLYRIVPAGRDALCADCVLARR
jgi:hypothetical protein